MGSAHSMYRDYDWKSTPGTCRERIICYPMADSPTGDGLSVISDPLDKYMTKDQLWQALVRWRKVPLRTPATLEMEVTEEEDGTIVTKRVMDTSKITEGHSGLVRKVDATSPIRICRTEVDHEGMMMTRSIFYGDGRSLAHNRDFIRVTTDPLIVEAWRIDVSSGTRLCEDDLSSFMETILNQVVTMKGDAMPDIEEIDNSQSSVRENLSILCW
mmetsp:Transcript_43074/g.134582  ORF Transcript_43074/g.134582 Transcript_43074/m.134582 type:complete len:214 (-) Transcript_43074:169-810(-)